MAASEPQQGPAQETCWICFDQGTPERPLTLPCHCPRSVHADCLGRWQLHSSGKSEETHCRFCGDDLPDWKAAVLGEEEEEPREPLIAAVMWQNTVYKIPIKPGAEGKAEFKRTVNELFGLSLGSRFTCTFECKLNDDKLRLKGLNSYEAATRCAARSSLIQVPGAAAPAAAWLATGAAADERGFRTGSL